jgi:hypothetical protein
VFNLPGGPWLGFNNTVTCGALLVGLYVAYPVYYGTRVICERLPFVQPPAESGAETPDGEFQVTDYSTRTAA